MARMRGFLRNPNKSFYNCLHTVSGFSWHRSTFGYTLQYNWLYISFITLRTWFFMGGVRNLWLPSSSSLYSLVLTRSRREKGGVKGEGWRRGGDLSSLSKGLIAPKQSRGSSEKTSRKSDSFRKIKHIFGTREVIWQSLQSDLPIFFVCFFLQFFHFFQFFNFFLNN